MSIRASEICWKVTRSMSMMNKATGIWNLLIVEFINYSFFQHYLSAFIFHSFIFLIIPDACGLVHISRNKISAAPNIFPLQQDYTFQLRRLGLFFTWSCKQFHFFPWGFGAANQRDSRPSPLPLPRKAILILNLINVILFSFQMQIHSFIHSFFNSSIN